MSQYFSIGTQVVSKRAHTLGSLTLAQKGEKGVIEDVALTLRDDGVVEATLVVIFNRYRAAVQPNEVEVV